MGLLDIAQAASNSTGTIGPIPRNRALGLVADGLLALNNWATAKEEATDGGSRARARAQSSGLLGQAVMEALGVPAVAATVDRMSYGLPLTRGTGQARQMLPETRDALLAVAPGVAKYPKQAAALGAGLLGGGAETGAMKAAMAWHGPLKKGDMAAEHLQDLISSQRFLDRDVVARKIKAGEFDVRVSPSFDVEGRNVRAILDGHHALEAAIRSGNRPNFIEMTPQSHDAVSLLNRGDPQSFLEATWNDSPWYFYSNKSEIW